MADGKRSLLDDDEDEEEEVAPRLGFNQQFATRFTHNKKREDLHRLQELEKKGLARTSDDESSSSEEEDDDGLLPARVEEKIFETLTKIKERDPSIYSEETKFFEDVEEDEIDVASKVKAQRPLYLKDVVARQLLAGGMEDEGDITRKRKPPTSSYFSEQDELKRAFLEGVREVEGDEVADNLLRVKKRTKEELERDAREVEEAVEEAEQRQKDKSIAKRLEEYFGIDDDLDDNDKFLKDYLLNKGWIDQDERKPRYPTWNDENISEDEEALDKQDKFEKDYNFRFQEVDNLYVQGHSRIIDDSVRKKSEARKKQRESKKERISEKERVRREELKRLKNVKKNEVLDKLSKIRAIAGLEANGGIEVLMGDDFDEDFDPDEYDKKMKEAFGEEYYGAEDPDFVDGEDLDDDIEKPDFDAEDDLLVIAPEADSEAGFAATRAKLNEAAKAGKKKLKVPFEEKLLIDKHLEEYYKLDYEDVVGDMPTRFKYRPVKPNKFGLKTKDIIGLDDKELNQFVSLKKLAPYTTEEWEPRGPVPRLSKKARKKKALNSEETPKKKKEVLNGEEIPENDNETSDSEETSREISEEVATEKRKKRSRKVVEDGKVVRSIINGKKKKKSGAPAAAEAEVITVHNGSTLVVPDNSETTSVNTVNYETTPVVNTFSGKEVENGEVVEDGEELEEGEKSRSPVGSNKRKRRQRKKSGAPSPLPMARLLSYVPGLKKRKFVKKKRRNDSYRR